jgi:hypothetical protein
MKNLQLDSIPIIIGFKIRDRHEGASHHSKIFPNFSKNDDVCADLLTTS